MTSESLPIAPATPVEKDHLSHAFPILAGHFIHDTYTAAVAPLLPVLIEKLSLSLTSAGFLSLVMQVPGLLNPLIGYLADRGGVRFMVIMAPAVTATLVSLIGLAPTYWMIAILLFTAGISTACFHAPAPAMVARSSGRRVGLGMSLFMASGELGFTVGPLLIVWALSQWTLEGIWRLMFLGWAASLMLFVSLRRTAPRFEKPGSLRAMFPAVYGVFIPIFLINLFRSPLVECLTTYLPTFMISQGAELWLAGVSLSIVEFAGIPGALSIGSVSDRVGRKRALIGASLLATLSMIAFLFVDGWMTIALLALMGFSAFATTPVLLATVQEQFPHNRATANGLFMAVTFLIRVIGTPTVGLLGDLYSLETAYLVAAGISLLMLPVIMFLPDRVANDA